MCEIVHCTLNLWQQSLISSRAGILCGSTHFPFLPGNAILWFFFQRFKQHMWCVLYDTVKFMRELHIPFDIKSILPEFTVRWFKISINADFFVLGVSFPHTLLHGGGLYWFSCDISSGCWDGKCRGGRWEARKENWKNKTPSPFVIPLSWLSFITFPSIFIIVPQFWPFWLVNLSVMTDIDHKGCINTTNLPLFFQLCHNFPHKPSYFMDKLSHSF